MAEAAGSRQLRQQPEPAAQGSRSRSRCRCRSQPQKDNAQLQLSMCVCAVCMCVLPALFGFAKLFVLPAAVISRTGVSEKRVEREKEQREGDSPCWWGRLGQRRLNVTLCALIKYNFGALKWRRARQAKRESSRVESSRGESSQRIARKVLKIVS